jgi:hypothetical protein
MRLCLIAATLMLVPAIAFADDWHGSVAGGFDLAFTPETSGFGFVLFEAYGEDKVGQGDVRLYYNTDTVHLEIERVPMGKDFEFSVALRGEVALAGVLFQYYEQGQRRDGLGFFASYIVLLPKVQWHPGDHHTLELVTNVRRWFFNDRDTDPAYLLPANTWVFEPRLGYVYWNIDSPALEYRASRLFPRIEGVAVGASVGVDVRSDVRPWGFAGDGRNDPNRAIWTLNQWLRAGWQTHDRFRLELQQTFNWGWFQDDLTRLRVGGMNPYVVIVPGLPWSANLSERLAIAQLSGHVRPKAGKPQELGVLVSGGTINDPRRQGLLDSFGGVGGVALFTDLRWGRWQVYARVGYAFPSPWLVRPPQFSGFVGLGVDVF